MKWQCWILTAKRRILMNMDRTLAWPYGMSTQQENPGTRTEEANKPPPVTACTFRNDGSSQGTYISSLATTATRESSAEKSKEIITKKYQYGQEQMDSFEAAFHNEEALFNFEDGEGILEQTTPKKRTAENDIASPTGVVTETSETMIWDGNVEKVRK
jgi:hypothetical protein